MAGSKGDWIEVRGAREHNLRDVSCRIPRGRLTVVTGLSGSGKSSLAFDTLFAEGQRRYLESLPARVRALLEKLPRPDVDFVGGLAPAIAVGQFAGAPARARRSPPRRTSTTTCACSSPTSARRTARAAGASCAPSPLAPSRSASCASRRERG